MRWAIYTVAVIGCGRISFDPLASADGDAGADGAGGDAAFVCTSISQLPTAFDGPSPAWTMVQASLQPPFVDMVLNGQLSMTLVPNQISRYGFYESCSYDLRGSAFSIEIVGITAQAVGVEMGFGFKRGAGLVGVNIENSVLTSFDNVNGYVPHAAVAFSGVNHRFLRMRETAGNTFWETGPSATGPWTMQFTSVDLVDMTNATVEIYAGTFMPVASPGSATFDNLQ